MTALMALVGAGLTAALLQAPIALRTIENGQQSNVDEGREVVIRSQAEWATLWRQHSPDRPRPDVDFGREMVVAVFLGSRTNSGYAVEIADITNAVEGLVAHYRVTRPPDGAVTAQVLVFPYHLAAIPKRPGAVRFERIE